MIRAIASIVLVLGCAASAQHAGYSAYDAFLKMYVCNDGVDYRRIIGDTALSQPVRELTSITKAGYESLSEKGKAAYLINLYNLFTIHLIATHYPLQTGIRDIHSPWDTMFVPLFGKKVSLNYIEHELLRKKFNEPHIHFALVCASRSCPALRNGAYTGNALDAQLTE